jgi:hypothetical protein
MLNAEEEIRLKQYVSLRSKGRHNKAVFYFHLDIFIFENKVADGK